MLNWRTHLKVPLRIAHIVIVCGRHIQAAHLARVVGVHTQRHGQGVNQLRVVRFNVGQIRAERGHRKGRQRRQKLTGIRIVGHGQVAVHVGQVVCVSRDR